MVLSTGGLSLLLESGDSAPWHGLVPSAWLEFPGASHQALRPLSFLQQAFICCGGAGLLLPSHLAVQEPVITRPPTHHASRVHGGSRIYTFQLRFIETLTLASCRNPWEIPLALQGVWTPPRQESTQQSMCVLGRVVALEPLAIGHRPPERRSILHVTYSETGGRSSSHSTAPWDDLPSPVTRALGH